MAPSLQCTEVSRLHSIPSRTRTCSLFRSSRRVCNCEFPNGTKSLHQSCSTIGGDIDASDKVPGEALGVYDASRCTV